jgi:peptide/nickel transport system permease protein
MLSSIFGRMAQALLVLLLLSFAAYMLIGMMPGDPIDLMIAGNPGVTPEMIANLRSIYGLDQPLALRYWHWLAAALTGDFGFSRLHARPVLEVLGPAILSTARLMVTAFVLSVTIALGLGIAASLRPGRAADRAIGLFAFTGMSMPPFWLGLLLVLLFAVKLHWLPASGSGDGGAGEAIRHLVLPVATLTLATIGHFIRYVRAAMVEAWQMDHIRTAWGKGAGKSRIVLVHALPHALIPVVTVMALSFGTMFSGALVTETIFAQPGMGKLIYDAVQGNDFNLALVALLFAALITLLSNFAADLAYRAADPRIDQR